MNKENFQKNGIALASSLIGEDIHNVQGGGGNTSLKVSESLMLIKPSGILLKNLEGESDFSLVNFKAVQEAQKTDLSDDQYTDVLNINTENNLRPSMEAGFHAILGKCVVHTHSVYVNTLACSKEGKEISCLLFPDSFWVPYSKPGIQLTNKIKKVLPKIIPKSGMVILENHGLIIWDDGPEDMVEMNQSINNKIKEYLNFLDFKLHEHINIDDVPDIAKVLFPDQVVFTLADNQTLSMNSSKEILSAYFFIIENILFNNLTPNYLDQKFCNDLIDMESEKYRISIAR